MIVKLSQAPESLGWAKVAFACEGPVDSGGWVRKDPKRVYSINMFLTGIARDLFQDAQPAPPVNLPPVGDSHDLYHEGRTWKVWFDSRQEYLQWSPETSTWDLDWPKVVAKHLRISEINAHTIEGQLRNELGVSELTAPSVTSFLKKYLVPALIAGQPSSARDILDAADWYAVAYHSVAATRIPDLVPVELRQSIVEGLVRSNADNVEIFLPRIIEDAVYWGLYSGLQDAPHLPAVVAKLLTTVRAEDQSDIEIERRFRLMMVAMDLASQKEASSLAEMTCLQGRHDAFAQEFRKLCDVSRRSTWEWDPKRKRLRMAR